MKVPSVGESVTEVTIASWNKKDGEQVALDEVLCELESDKATFELPAEAAGTLRIVAQAGETLPIGAVIAKIETGAAAAQPLRDGCLTSTTIGQRKPASINAPGTTIAAAHDS